ncbi:MAG: tetratricopeptide repeat protein, partial [Candidatus Hodarchaeota archaeon]
MNDQPSFEKAWRLLEECLDLIKLKKFNDALQNINTAISIVNDKGSEKEIADFNEKLREITESVVRLATQSRSLIFADDSGKVKEALPYLKIARAVSEQLKEYQQAADCEWDIAFALQREDKYSKSINHYASAEKLYKQINDLKKAANSLTNMGYLLYRLGRNSEAKTAYEDAIGIYKKFSISEEMGDAEVGLARVLESSEVDEAIKHYTNAEKIFNNLEESRPEKIADIKINIGHYQFSQKKDAEAFQTLDEARKLYKQANNASGIARVDLNIGMLLSRK